MSFTAECLQTSLLSFACDQLFVFFSDRGELFHLFVERLGFLQSNQEFRSLDGAAVVGSLTLFTTTRLLNVNGLRLESDVLSVAIPDETFCGDDSGGGCIAESVHDQVIVLLKDLLSEEDVKRFVLAVGHVDLVRINAELDIFVVRLVVLALHLFCKCRSGVLNNNQK